MRMMMNTAAMIMTVSSIHSFLLRAFDYTAHQYMTTITTIPDKSQSRQHTPAKLKVHIF